jgi:uncharacterized protein YdiU (UPF0061 family)
MNFSLDHLRADNAYVRELPGDALAKDEQGLRPDPAPRQVQGAAWSRVQPTPVSAPKLLAWSAETAALLELSPQAFDDPQFAQQLAEVMAGNRQLPGMQPYAACYGGHQFGNWAGQLGDGRAISLIETVNVAGERWELQLKGAGRTPYSRSADGRAVLRSSIREFLCSEAMYHLGVPTTRALSLVGTGDAVVRDMFYDGNARPEPGAIVCRVAPSFIRFGHFELPAARGDLPLLRQLVEFVMRRDFPWLLQQEADPQQRLVLWFAEVCRRTAEMVAHWQRVGFVHGVMNTDNMSILGLTIDYGPYGWVDNFDSEWTPNTTDAGGRRYRYGRQPQVAGWNLSCLAGALLPLFESEQPLQDGLDVYVATLQQQQAMHHAAKLGFSQCSDDDLRLVRELEQLMQQHEVDMTMFYRRLMQLDPARIAAEDDAGYALLGDAFYDESARLRGASSFADWLQRYAARSRHDAHSAEQRLAVMQRANPLYVLRNYLAQEAIDLAEAGDASRIMQLLQCLRQPYVEQAGCERFAERRPDWARHKAGCSMLSCSS